MIRVDAGAIREAAARVSLKGVFRPQRRSWSGVRRVEHRMIAKGRDGQLRAVVIEWRGRHERKA
jgi:hypothetical protein